ncbi:MAG TPA: hypothetical protein VI893_08175 [Thermoplasmata archaeon]|nr:hypothetical protein [Thermoplasmata archaeon]
MLAVVLSSSAQSFPGTNDRTDPTSTTSDDAINVVEKVRTTPVQTLVVGEESSEWERDPVQAGPPGPDPEWSCQQANWRDCLDLIVDPSNPGPGQRINFSIIAKKPDDFIRKGIFHYRYKTPYQPWNPIVSFYDLDAQNVSNAANKEAWVELFGYLGGTLIEFFWDVYDLKNERLHSDVPPTCPPHQPSEGCLEISGNKTWPDQCPVPTGFAECVDINFGYFQGVVKQPLSDGDNVPQVANVWVNVTTKFQTPMAAATINYGLYESAGTCGDPGKVVKYGPNFEAMVLDRPVRINASIDTLSTSEPGLDLCFNVTATDIYQRPLISPTYTLHTSDEEVGQAIWTGRFMVVVYFINESFGKNQILYLPAVRVEFTNASGLKHENYTDSIGIAYSDLLVYKGQDTWTISAFYQGAISEIREKLPNRDRESTGNYTFYLPFSRKDIPAPRQEDVDQNYFAFMAAGILGFLAIFAPLSGRHFMEKRRREELKRQEKETRFKL